MNIYAREFRLELESQDVSRQTRQALWERGNNDPKRSTNIAKPPRTPHLKGIALSHVACHAELGLAHVAYHDW